MFSRREDRKPNALQSSRLDPYKNSVAFGSIYSVSAQLLGIPSSLSPNFVRLGKKREINMKGRGAWEPGLLITRTQENRCPDANEVGGKSASTVAPTDATSAHRPAGDSSNN